MAAEAPVPRSRAALLITAAAGLLIFAVLAALVAGHPEPFAVDRAGARLAGSVRGPALTPLMLAAAAAGSSPSIAVQISVIGGGILFLRREARPALWLLAAFLGCWVLANGFKALLDRPRPMGGLVEALGTAFPSGHATQAGGYYVMLAVVLAESFPSRWRWVGAALAVLVGTTSGLSRIYLGVHWVTDVIGGFALGLAWASVLLALRRSGGPRSEPEPPAPAGAP